MDVVIHVIYKIPVLPMPFASTPTTDQIADVLKIIMETDMPGVNIVRILL